MRSRVTSAAPMGLTAAILICSLAPNSYSQETTIRELEAERDQLTRRLEEIDRKIAQLRGFTRLPSPLSHVKCDTTKLQGSSFEIVGVEFDVAGDDNDPALIWTLRVKKDHLRGRDADDELRHCKQVMFGKIVDGKFTATKKGLMFYPREITFAVNRNDTFKKGYQFRVWTFLNDEGKRKLVQSGVNAVSFTSR